MHTPSRLILTAALAGAAVLLPLTAAGPAFADGIRTTATLTITADSTVQLGKNAGYTYALDENAGGDPAGLTGRLVLDVTQNGVTTSRTAIVNSADVGGGESFPTTAAGQIRIEATFVPYSAYQSATPATAFIDVVPAVQAPVAATTGAASTGAPPAGTGTTTSSGASASGATHAGAAASATDRSGTVTHASSAGRTQTGPATDVGVQSGSAVADRTTPGVAASPIAPGASDPHPSAVTTPVTAQVASGVVAATTTSADPPFLPIAITAAVVGLLGLTLVALVIVLIVRKSRGRVA